MKNERGITLVMLVMTIILMLIIVGLSVQTGMDTYNDSMIVKFETYMKMLQKNVDIIIEGGTEYINLGSALTTKQKETLQTIITDNEYIETESVDEVGLRYFSAQDIEETFGIKDISDEIIINFVRREVISLNGVEKDGTIYYVEKGL